jgi:hypothetical protein
MATNFDGETIGLEILSIRGAGTGLAIQSSTRLAMTLTGSIVTELTAGTTTLADTQCLIATAFGKLGMKGLL